MGQYSIKDIEQLSKVKAHTLRIWEKRYNIFNTKRTDTNIRFYDDQDLKQILNVALLVHQGIKISKVAAMSPQERIEQVKEISLQYDASETQVNALILALIDMNEVAFEKTIAACLTNFGVERTIIEVVYPFLHKIGVLWQTGAIRPAQEHFMSNLIRQKLLIAIDALIIPEKCDAKRFMLFLPEEELHELGLIFANYILRVRGHHTLYLGQSVPLQDLIDTADDYQPQYLFTIITNKLIGKELDHYLKQLIHAFKGRHLLVTGRNILDLDTSRYPEITFFKDPQETIAYIDNETLPGIAASA